MRRDRRGALQLGAAGVVLLVAGPQIAWGASIVAVRVWPAADYTRVTIESDVALQARHFLADNPRRVVIDVDGLELSPELRELVGEIRPGDPFIRAVRIGQNMPRVVRLVIDLKQATQPQVFTLEPVAAYRHRLVFDLYPSTERDPLAALIEEKAIADKAAATSVAAAPSERAASAVNDALGEFIGEVDRRPQVAAAPAASAVLQPPLPPLVPPVAPPIAQRPADAPPPRGPVRATDRLVIVALDPGHGGEDPGATGPTGLHEKDVVLQVAQKLRERINAQPNMRAMMTRDADFFVPLNERVRKARRVQADLFISIHADAFVRPHARGASVFALSESGATSVEARWMANKENASDDIGGVNLKSKDDAVSRALLDMSTSAQIKDSLKLGNEVLGRIGQVGRLHKGSVEQAGFAVLKAPDVPSILVETAFISNPEEEAQLRDPAYQAQLVEALVSGINRYFAKNPPLARNRST